jgi:succinoglycan biosynthesis transport protein ExoP
MAEPSPPLREYLRFLKRQAPLIALVPAISIATAALFVSAQDPVYRASMGIIVTQGGGETRPEIGDRALTQTMTQILESNEVAQRVVDELNLPMTSADLLKKLKIEVKPDSAILGVSYDSKDRQEARAVLASLGRSFLTQAREQLGATNSPKNPGPLGIFARISDRPHVDPDPVAPQPVRTIGFAGALGLALGLILAFARESLDDRIRGRGNAEDWFGAPVIGTLPRGFRGKPPAYLREVGRGRVRQVEALQILRANFQFMTSGLSGPTLVVTSAVGDEGKTTVVASLSMSLAIGGEDVIAVESDLRRPNLHAFLGVPTATTGLADVLDGRAKLADALHEVELFHPSGNGANGTAATETAARPGLGGRLRVLSAGTSTTDPTSTLTADRLAKLVAELKKQSSYVIFDSPALLLAGEALPLAVGVDSVIVVARQGYTTRTRAEGVRAMLRGLGAQKVVVVLIDASEALRARVE